MRPLNLTSEHINKNITYKTDENNKVMDMASRYAVVLAKKRGFSYGEQFDQEIKKHFRHKKILSI